MEIIKKGDPAPYDGFIINQREYSKIVNDKKLLHWVSKKIKSMNSKYG